MARFRTNTLAIPAVWTAFALLATTQQYLRLRTTAEPVGWFSMLGFQLGYWSGWAVLTPSIFRIGRRYRFAPGRRAISAVAHLVVGALVSLVLIVWFSVLMKWFTGPGHLDHDSALSQVILRYLGLGFHFDLLTYGAVAGAGLALQAFQRLRDQQQTSLQLQKELAEAQLDVLRMQLQPHFLFNTLHAASALMDEDVGAARRVLARLGELLRLTLDRRGRQEVTLEEELELLDRYLDIQSIRYRDRLQVVRRLQPEALEILVPTLILQPLVENAVRHGLEAVQGSEPFVIEIVARKDADTVRISVRDTGPGASPGRPSPDSNGVGLPNIRERLRRRYGEAAALEVSNRPQGGFEATITLPAGSPG